MVAERELLLQTRSIQAKFMATSSPSTMVVSALTSTKMVHFLTFEWFKRGSWRNLWDTSPPMAWSILSGLEILGEHSGQSMYELILDDGTIVLQADATKDCKLTRVTGWKFEEGPHGSRVCSGAQSYTAKTNGNHQLFTNGKPKFKLEHIEDLKAALEIAGLLWRRFDETGWTGLICDRADFAEEALTSGLVLRVKFDR